MNTEYARCSTDAATPSQATAWITCGRFVAPITTTCASCPAMPSNCTRNSVLSRRLASCSPDPEPPRHRRRVRRRLRRNMPQHVLCGKGGKGEGGTSTGWAADLRIVRLGWSQFRPGRSPTAPAPSRWRTERTIKREAVRGGMRRNDYTLHSLYIIAFDDLVVKKQMAQSGNPSKYSDGTHTARDLPGSQW